MSDRTDNPPALDDCNCCDLPADAPIDNRPGLPAVRFRAGTFATFFENMKAELAAATIPADGANPGARPLAALTTRSSDDPAVALLDACAVVGEILTFYQERIANEGYLRTATERRSVLELARAIGYELNPGVAASTFLAFTLDEPLKLAGPVPPSLTPQALGLQTPKIVTIASGLKVQSVPGPGQLPQTFETVEDIQARISWSFLKPRGNRPQRLVLAGGQLRELDATGKSEEVVQTVWLDGTGTNLRPGDLLLFTHATKQAAILVTSVTPDFDGKRTAVGLAQKTLKLPLPFAPEESTTLATVDTTPLPLTPDNVESQILEQAWDERDLQAYLAIQRWDPDTVTGLVSALVAERERPRMNVFALRARTGVFGHSAPLYQSLKAAYPNGATLPWNDWDSSPNTIWTRSNGDFYSKTLPVDLFLDRVMTGVAPGGWVVLADPQLGLTKAFLIEDVQEASLADFAISGKATGLKLKGASSKDKLGMRTTSVFLQSEPLAFAPAPIPEPVWDADGQPVLSLMLDQMILGLTVGQNLAWSGVTANSSGAPSGSSASEIVSVDHVVHDRGYTIVHFAEGPTQVYVRAQTTLNGNVARATHGETTARELLGSGDGSAANQVFTLKRPPLTYVSAPTPSGGQSTLTVRVAGVAWQERPSLYGLDPASRSYTLRTDDDGSTRVIFGDGRSGARLPTGQDNVVAGYRTGLGPGGELGPNSLTLLMSKPLGVKNVNNPVPATGSAPPERLADARLNAPRVVLTLDRIVSLEDFGNFTRAFAGIGKAMAIPLWSGRTRLIHLTVASAAGGPVPPKSSLYANLAAGIADASDGAHEVLIDSFAARSFKLDANVIVDPDRDATVVLAAATAAVKTAFSFAARSLAQPVTESEVLSILQAVDGVVAIEINALYADGDGGGVNGVIPAHAARFHDDTTIDPAELLLLHPAGLTLTAVTR